MFCKTKLGIHPKGKRNKKELLFLGIVNENYFPFKLFVNIFNIIIFFFNYLHEQFSYLISMFRKFRIRD